MARGPIGQLAQACYEGRLSQEAFRVQRGQILTRIVSGEIQAEVESDATLPRIVSPAPVAASATTAWTEPPERVTGGSGGVAKAEKAPRARGLWVGLAALGVLVVGGFLTWALWPVPAPPPVQTPTPERSGVSAPRASLNHLAAVSKATKQVRAFIDAPWTTESLGTFIAEWSQGDRMDASSWQRAEWYPDLSRRIRVHASELAPLLHEPRYREEATELVALADMFNVAIPSLEPAKTATPNSLAERAQSPKPNARPLTGDATRPNSDERVVASGSQPTVIVEAKVAAAASATAEPERAIVETAEKLPLPAPAKTVSPKALVAPLPAQAPLKAPVPAAAPATTPVPLAVAPATSARSGSSPVATAQDDATKTPAVSAPTGSATVTESSPQLSKPSPSNPSVPQASVRQAASPAPNASTVASSRTAAKPPVSRRGCDLARAKARAQCLDALRSGHQGVKMIALPGGSYVRGSDISEAESPQTKVSIGYPFALARFETSFADYAVFCRSTGRPCPSNPWNDDAMPVVGVSWFDASAYAAWLSEETGKPYRLPSEAEWEFAARAGSSTTYPFGDQPDVERDIRYASDQPARSRGGAYRRNKWGLYHLPGNVREWMADAWLPDHRRAPTDGRPVRGASQAPRAVRGGAFSDGPDGVRPSSRVALSPSTKDRETGFRVLLDLRRTPWPADGS